MHAISGMTDRQRTDRCFVYCYGCTYRLQYTGTKINTITSTILLSITVLL